MSGQRLIYFLRPVGLLGPVKIGCSVFPANRALYLSTWSPMPLEVLAEVPGGFDIEAALHERFADDHYHHEWFHASGDLLRGIEQVKASGDFSAAFGLTPRTAEAGKRFRALRAENNRSYGNGLRAVSA